jgi:hypothetical protein
VDAYMTSGDVVQYFARNFFDWGSTELEEASDMALHVMLTHFPDKKARWPHHKGGIINICVNSLVQSEHFTPHWYPSNLPAWYIPGLLPADKITVDAWAKGKMNAIVAFMKYVWANRPDKHGDPGNKSTPRTPRQPRDESERSASPLSIHSTDTGVSSSVIPKRKRAQTGLSGDERGTKRRIGFQSLAITTPSESKPDLSGLQVWLVTVDPDAAEDDLVALPSSDPDHQWSAVVSTFQLEDYLEGKVFDLSKLHADFGDLVQDRDVWTVGYSVDRRPTHRLHVAPTWYSSLFNIYQKSTPDQLNDGINLLSVPKAVKPFHVPDYLRLASKLPQAELVGETFCTSDPPTWATEDPMELDRKEEAPEEDEERIAKKTREAAAAAQAQLDDDEEAEEAEARRAIKEKSDADAAAAALATSKEQARLA